MSLATFARKSAVTSSGRGCKRSGKSPGGWWLPSMITCCKPDREAEAMVEGPEGFSYIGRFRSNRGPRDMRMSQSGTPFRGVYPRNYRDGQSAWSVLNASDAAVQVDAEQQLAIKRPVTSAGRLATAGRVRAVVKPTIVTGPLVERASYGRFVRDLQSANTCSLPVNDKQAWEGACHRTCTRQRGYTKFLHQPVAFSIYQDALTRGCAALHDTPLETKYRFGTCVLG